MKKTKSTSASEEIKFSKQAFLRNEYYRRKEDLLNALLEDDKTYATAEVDNLIGDFLKGKVN